MKSSHAFLLLIAVTLIAAEGRAQTTAFTFQGRLNDTGVPASGSYDLQLKLYDTAVLGTGTQVGATVTFSAVPVTNGAFSVQPDFTANAFSGADRFVEVGVKLAGSAAAFNLLSPRQPITSVPYAIRGVSAATADSATNASHATNADSATNANTASTATNATQLGGQPSSSYVQTNDARLTDARAPTAGSTNYIQNTTTQEAGNFNISGNGFIGGKVGIGTATSSSKLGIVGAQDALSMTGSQPFLTLQDSNAANKRSRIQGVQGDINLFTESYLNGSNLFSFIHLDSATGNVGVGSSAPVGKLEVVAQDAVRLIGYQPFLTLFDSNAGYARARVQDAGGDLNLFTESYLSGANPSSLLKLANSGNVGIGSPSPNTKLTLSGGPVWTSNFWTASLNLQNASAFGWEANASGQRFGIGQSTGGLYFFRTQSAFGTTNFPANYDLQITDTGNLTQPRAQNGLVKAMARVQVVPCTISSCAGASATIVQCYNSVTNSTSGGCGFSLSRITINSVDMYFGFPVSDRFFSLTLNGQGNAPSVYQFFDQNTATIIFNSSGTEVFYVLVY